MKLKKEILRKGITYILTEKSLIEILFIKEIQKIRKSLLSINTFKYYKIDKTVSKRLIFVSVLFFLTAYPSVFEEFIIFN